jgi:hypothetical protein
MAKTKNSIEVVTRFDGEQDATSLFTSLILEEYRRRKSEQPLAIPELTVHNTSEVPIHSASELCG